MKLATIALCLMLAACSGAPKKPRVPDDAQRVPINRTLPAEISK